MFNKDKLLREAVPRRERKRIGRPPKEPAPGTRVSLGLKVTPQIKALLDGAAKANGRTQSQEAEARLERSFEREDLLPELLSSVCGPATAGHVLALGLIMFNAGLHEHWSRSDFLSPIDDRWLDDPTAFDQAIRGALAWLNAARPTGEVLESKASPGLQFAEEMIEAVKKAPAQDDPLGPHHLAAIRSLLGPLAQRMTWRGHPWDDLNVKLDETAEESDYKCTVIKRYALRRLYNTETSTYVTLDDLAAMVKGERDFVVIDANTGNDVTHSVLTEILVHQDGLKHGDTRGMAEPVPPKSPQANVPIVSEPQQHLVPILTLDQAMELSAFKTRDPSRFGGAEIISPRFPCGPRAFALKVFNSDGSTLYREGDLLILDPDQSPEFMDTVLAQIDGRPCLAELQCVKEKDYAPVLVTHQGQREHYLRGGGPQIRAVVTEFATRRYSTYRAAASQPKFSESA